MNRVAITFLVPGVERSGDVSTTRSAAVASQPGAVLAGRVKQSVAVSSQRAASGGTVPVSAVPGEDVVVLHIDGGPSLVLHPDHARDLLLSQRTAGPARSGAEPAGGVTVPVRLEWRALEEQTAARGLSRGFLGNVMLKAVDVVTDLAADKAADFAAATVVKRFDSQVEAGVYALSPDALPALKEHGRPLREVPGGADKPSLVLIHGTFSTTSGTFGKLWSNNPDRVASLFEFYRQRVFALDHPTLGASPIANAITLVRAMPMGARLHLLTHSRGGLVAEALAKACAQGTRSLSPFADKGYANQREELRELIRLVAERSIGVERIVRVACPSRGTLLASGRVDAYLSVFKWALELAGIPVAPVLIELLTEVARRRADPAQLPGLAAQMPDSPLVRWLHMAPVHIPGELRVVAGDMDGDSVVTWLKTLLADAFYWTDNDLVVQTRSMYGGSPRAGGATFLRDEGGRVTHFNYFANDHTAGAIVNALTQPQPPAFTPIGPLSWQGESATGTRGGRAARPKGNDAERPAVILVPGIFGSHLRVGGRRVWLEAEPGHDISSLDYRARGEGVSPDGLLDIYSGMTAALADRYEVIPFAYDWRRPIEAGARALADLLNAALARRRESTAPVRVVTHSSGGLLLRTVQLERPAIWRRFIERPGARALLLGPPNRGCWMPIQVLSGDETLNNALTSTGLPFTSAAVRRIFACFPGLLQLQAGLTEEHYRLGEAATWKMLAERDIAPLRSSRWHTSPLQLDAYEWGVPSPQVLDKAVALRRRLDAQTRADLRGASDAIVMVTGRAPLTPDGYEHLEQGSGTLVYREAQEAGDGRVPLARVAMDGIPQWSADADHTELVSRRELYAAYEDLLGTGNTVRLPVTTAGEQRLVTPAAAVVRTRASRGTSSGTPPDRREQVLEVRRATRVAGRTTSPALRITVVNGDLTFVPSPLMLGHYRASKLTGTERVMNGLIGGAMQAALERGLYPVKPGTHQVFVNTRTRPDNPWQLPRPRSVIIAGLGEEGNLRAAALVDTIRQAVIAWAQRAAEERDVPDSYTLATTLIGSGGTGITAAESAQLIAQAVREANERLDDDEASQTTAARAVSRGARPPRWPRAGELQIIELYGDRASEAWRALQLLATSAPSAYSLTGPVVPGTGALRQPLDTGYRGADYDLISAISEGDGNDSAIVFTIDTRRARSEVRAHKTQGPLIRNLVSTAATNVNADPQIGQTLFQLLVPREVQAFLGGSTDTQIEVNRGTAGIPWEMLDVRQPGSSDSRPWAIRTKLLRKLRTDDFRERVIDAGADDAVLVIGDPRADRAVYPPLYGARSEAQAVAACFGESGADGRYVRALVSAGDGSAPEPDAKAVINAVLERDWRIVHVAGHGEPPLRTGQTDTNPRGVVLSDGAFLGPREIECMRTVPELVFVNCCHLAARNPNQLLTGDGPNRPEFAAGVAEALIGIGVRCVIAAGWAVDDNPANAFASTFYSALIGGCRFIDAVAQAREAARRMGGNTWAAYQCYGDPDW